VARVNIELVAGRKKMRRKIRNEVGKGSDKIDEAEEYNTQRRIITKRDRETVIGVTMEHIQNYPCPGLDRPLGSRDVTARRISRQRTHESGKVERHTRRPPLPPTEYPWYSFPMTTSRIEPTNFLLQVQRLHELSYGLS